MQRKTNSHRWAKNTTPLVSDKANSLSQEQIMQIMVTAIPHLDNLPKAPTGEAAGQKASKC